MYNVTLSGSLIKADNFEHSSITIYNCSFEYLVLFLIYVFLFIYLFVL
jgi:hypothetical protein